MDYDRRSVYSLDAGGADKCVGRLMKDSLISSTVEHPRQEKHTHTCSICPQNCDNDIVNLLKRPTIYSNADTTVGVSVCMLRNRFLSRGFLLEMLIQIPKTTSPRYQGMCVDVQLGQGQGQDHKYGV